MRVIYLLALTSVLYLGTAESAITQTTPDCPTLSVAFYELGALYYRTAAGTYTGIDKDVIDELAQRSHCRFVPLLESRVRIWSQLQSNTLDMSVSAIPNAEREKFAYFIPYFVTRNYVLMDKNVPVAARSPEGFLADSRLTVAVIKSFRHGPVLDAWLDNMRAQQRVIEVADFDTQIRLLSVHRVDAVLALPTSWEPVLKKDNNHLKIIVLDWAPDEHIVHALVFSKGRVSRPTIEILRSHIMQMSQDGSLERIFQKHISPELARAIHYDYSKP